MIRITVLFFLLCSVLSVAIADQLTIGTISHSDNTFTINTIPVPAYTINDTTCIFVGDLEASGFTLLRDTHANRVTIQHNTSTQTAATAISPRKAESVGGSVMFPALRLFISKRQIPAYEYKGRLLMCVKDLSVFGTLEIHPEKKQIIGTLSNDAWRDDFGFTYNFGTITKTDIDIAPEFNGHYTWQYVYLKLISSTNSHEIFVSDSVVDDDTCKQESLTFVGQILAGKSDIADVEENINTNPRLNETVQYLKQDYIIQYLYTVKYELMLSELIQSHKKLIAAQAAIKAIIQKAFRANGNRPLKITNYWVDQDEIDTSVANVSILNLSDKTVDAIDLDIYCYDTFGRPVNFGKRGNCQKTIYQDTIESGYEVSIFNKLYTRDLTTRITPVIRLVHFTDGTVWRPSKTSSTHRTRRH